jgi:hypothetical protein
MTITKRISSYQFARFLKCHPKDKDGEYECQSRIQQFLESEPADSEITQWFHKKGYGWGPLYGEDYYYYDDALEEWADDYIPAYSIYKEIPTDILINAIELAWGKYVWVNFEPDELEDIQDVPKRHRWRNIGKAKKMIGIE